SRGISSARPTPTAARASSATATPPESTSAVRSRSRFAILAAMAKGLLACLLLATGGCFGADVASAFPPGLEPLEPSTAGLPPQPDTVAIVTGENSNFTFGHARGRVSAAPGGVWAALKEPAVVASRRQTDSWSYTLDETPLYEYSFTIHYE